MAFLTQGLFSHHARQRHVSPSENVSGGRVPQFDVFAFALNRDDGSAPRQHVVDCVEGPSTGEAGGADGAQSRARGSSRPTRGSTRGLTENSADSQRRFIDLSGLSAAAAVAALAAARLHVVVDLNGFTTDERSELLVSKPAPVAMHAVGFPGTMAASFVPYALLDRHASPPRSRAAMSERLVLMPHCYQVNSHAQHEVVLPAPSTDLPAGKVLLVNFNQLYKMSSVAAALWCSALVTSPRTALWLLRNPADGERNLRAEIASCGGAQRAE